MTINRGESRPIKGLRGRALADLTGLALSVLEGPYKRFGDREATAFVDDNNRLKMPQDPEIKANILHTQAAGSEVFRRLRGAGEDVLGLFPKE